MALMEKSAPGAKAGAEIGEPPAACYRQGGHE